MINILKYTYIYYTNKYVTFYMFIQINVYKTHTTHKHIHIKQHMCKMINIQRKKVMAAGLFPQ